MTILLWVGLGLLVAVLGFIGYLVWPGAGLGFIWVTAPGGALKYRIRRQSLLPQILGSDATCLFGVVHVGAQSISGYLHAHELCHAIQARRMGGWFAFLFQYLTRPATHKRLEDEAFTFGMTHREDMALRTHRRFARVT